MTALFEDVIFGPIRSRRLGISLGVNLLPEHAKICNFDCIYCECGSNSERRGDASERRFADVARVKLALEQRLKMMQSDGELPDVITFAGNGEPTLHPNFAEIVEFARDMRDRYAPKAKISVLSNATQLDRPEVVAALHRVDNNILKLDSALVATTHSMNRPTSPSYSPESVAAAMAQFEGECIVQTMFLRGVVDGVTIDNTTEEEISAWLEMVARVSPRSVMVYSIDRDTPCKGLERVSHDELERIAERVRALGIECSAA